MSLCEIKYHMLKLNNLKYLQNCQVALNSQCIEVLWQRYLSETQIIIVLVMALWFLKPLSVPMLIYCLMEKHISVKFTYEYNIFFQWDAFENVICKMLHILFRPQWVKWIFPCQMESNIVIICHPLAVIFLELCLVNLHLTFWLCVDVMLSLHPIVCSCKMDQNDGCSTKNLVS